MTSQAFAAPQTPDLTWRRAMRLGVLGLASDIRDRRRDPALRNPVSPRALDPRLHRPVFVIGAPRSGTTFLGSCLGRLPEISYHFEPRLTKAAARCVYDGSWSPRRGAAVFRLSYSALLLAALDGGHRFAEKNPENSFLVPFLAAEFPGAQFIHIVRDGRDAAVSHAEKPWLAAASAATGQRGMAGQLHGPQPRWWVERSGARHSRRCQISCGRPGAGGGSPRRPWTGWPRCRRAGPRRSGTRPWSATRQARPTCWPGSSAPRPRAGTKCGPEWGGPGLIRWGAGAPR